MYFPSKALSLLVYLCQHKLTFGFGSQQTQGYHFFQRASICFYLNTSPRVLNSHCTGEILIIYIFMQENEH